MALNEQFMVSSVHSGPASHPVILATSPVATSPIANLRPDGQARNHYRAHSNSHPPLSGSLATYSSAAVASQREMVDREAKEREEQSKRDNRVLSVLMRRLGHSKTFGENIIFMLNRSREYFTSRSLQPLISSQRTTPKISACSFLFSKFSICFSRHQAPRNTFSRMTCVFWWMSSFGSWWTFRMRAKQ